MLDGVLVEFACVDGHRKALGNSDRSILCSCLAGSGAGVLIVRPKSPSGLIANTYEELHIGLGRSRALISSLQ